MNDRESPLLAVRCTARGHRCRGYTSRYAHGRRAASPDATVPDLCEEVRG